VAALTYLGPSNRATARRRYRRRVDPAPELADYRRRVVLLYLAEPRTGREGAEAFRRGRDALFRDHPQSALTKDQRAGFRGLPYFPYDPEAVVRTRLEPANANDPLEIDTGGEDGVVRYRRVGLLPVPQGELTLYWMEGYGGGLFLPLRDASAGEQTYGGGRYLTDSAKGTLGRGLELDAASGEAVLDFNYAYNPSCAYNSRWACPLAPPENRLDEPILAGERTYPDAV
jgi:uncharacterized protein (DUF1684 family)